MTCFSRLAAGFLRPWASVPADVQPGFNRHVRLTNARRLNLIFATVVVTATALSLFRALLAHGLQPPQHHRHYLAMGAVIVASALTLLLIHRRIDAEKMPRSHALLMGATMLILGCALSVTAGIEYASVGGITRFYLTIFGLCTALILPPGPLLMAFAWTTLCLFATVRVMTGALAPFLIENIHLLGLFLLGGVISRTVATTFIRDYLLLQEVEHSNRQLRLEIHEREKIMRRLARSEQEFKNTFEYAPDAYILTDPTGRVSRINRSAQELVGRSVTQARGKHPHEVSFLHTNNLFQVERMLRETLLCGRSGPCELEKVIVTEDRTIHLELHASMIHLEDQEMVLTIARDITHRKEGEAILTESRKRLEERVRERTEELEHINRRLKEEITERIATEAALAKAETHYRLLVENMNEGLAIFDANNRFTYVNDCFCTMCGYSRDTLMGRDSTFVMAPEDHPLVRSQQRKRLLGDRTSYEARLATASGELLHIQISPEPMVDDQGTHRGSFVVITDITGIKKMEVALRKSEERARALLNSSGDAAMLATPSGLLLEVNEISCQLLKTPRVDLVGRSILEGFPNTITARHAAVFKEALLTNSIQRFEDHMASGRSYDITIHPIAHQERLDRVAIFARDITELKAAERHIRTLSQELIKAQENERQRIARDLHDNVAQDLATLKIGWDTLLVDLHSEKSPAFQEKTRALSSLLRGSIESIRGLAYNLQPPELEQLGLITAIRRYCEEQAALVNLSIDLFTAGVQELHLSFDTQINLYRLVQEALSNVRKHADATRVTIRLTASHPNLILNVEDNGRGFRVKERLAEAVTEKRMGVRSMEERVSLLKGTMKLTSSLGAGTRLRIEVPAERELPESKVA